MARIEEHKSSTEGSPIQEAALPSKVYILLSQHLGKPCDQLMVKVGDTVQCGQLLATAEAKVFAPVHASISGTIAAIADWPHPSLGKAKAIVIESDGRAGSAGRQTARPQEEAEKLTVAQIRELVSKAGVVGMGGAGFPTHIKLSPPAGIKTLIINIAECEPYLTGDSQLVIERPREIMLGIALVAKAVSAKNIIIAIEDNKPHAIKTLRDGAGAAPYAIRVLKSQYPQGGEKQLIKTILGIEVPRGKLPFDVGVCVQNVSTVYAVYEAIYKDKPLYERVVTVTGDALTKPANILARIGTPIKELIDFCGPLKETPSKIIVGGPMMGIAQFSDMAPVVKTTTGLIVFGKSRMHDTEEKFCIRCAACVRNCPAGLAPCLINLALEKGKIDQAQELGALDCIECGLCAYACPANRNLVQSIRTLKAGLKK